MALSKLITELILESLSKSEVHAGVSYLTQLTQWQQRQPKNSLWKDSSLKNTIQKVIREFNLTSQFDSLQKLSAPTASDEAGETDPDKQKKRLRKAHD
jgi:hypothetical protein